MKVKTILLGAAACVALAGQAWGQTDAPKKHKETIEQRLERMEQIIRDQQTEISDLKAQTQTQANAQPAVQPAPVAEAAPAQPASQAEVEALQNQVYEQAAADKSGWWNNTKISGRMYYDITDIDSTSRAKPSLSNPDGDTRSPEDGVNFDIKRFYVGIDHTFDDIFSANVTTDFTYDSTTAVSQIYLKKAYLQAKLDDALILRLGSADMPWIPFVEDLYGYRYVENTLIDRDKFGNSADWGLHALGSFQDGLISYQVSAVNGGGYKKAPIGTANRSKGIDVEGRVNLNYQGFTVGVGAYTGKLGKDTETPTLSSPPSTFRTASRFDATAAYTLDQIRVGVEYFHANNWMNVASPAAKDNDDGYSAFASYQFDPKWGLFGRYDWVRATTTSALNTTMPIQTPVKDNYYNIGVSFTPAKIVDFALVYKHENVLNGMLSTSNGTIGGPLNGVYNEIGLWGQLRW